MPSFTIIGSAHLNILSCVYDTKTTTSRSGTLSISYGGTGYNVASHLSLLGHKVVFGTVLADTTISRTIVQSLQRVGVRVRPEFRVGLSDAGLSAHMDADGRLISDVSSSPIGEEDFHRDHLLHMIRGADVVIIECSLSLNTLCTAIELAVQHGKPIWLAGVSEEKVLKVHELFLRGYRLNGLFVNKNELAALIRKIGGGGHARTDYWPCQIAAAISGYVIETRGQLGVCVWDGERSLTSGGGKLMPESFMNPDQPKPDMLPRRGRPNWLGAGDELLALTLSRHYSLGESVDKAAAEASRVVSKSPRRNGEEQPSSNPLEDRLRHISDAAYRDQLTGLLNRHGMTDALHQFDGHTQISLLMIDIDHFKRVNDVFGHDMGDKVLAEVSAILTRTIRTVDIACRWGGEEMILILPNASLTVAVDIAERIRIAIEEREFPGITDLDTEHRRRITVSIGVAEATAAELDLARDLADQCLYESKRGGRNRVTPAPAPAVNSIETGAAA